MKWDADNVREPDDPTWLADIAFDIVIVRRYDTDDILIGEEYYALIQDENVDDAFIMSSVARPAEPVDESD